MNRLNKIYIKTWHFGLLFVILFTLTNIIDTSSVKSTPQFIYDNRSIELDNNSISEVISSSQYSFILFYSKDCDLCKKMEDNLSQLMNKHQDRYYKLNIDDYSDSIDYLMISGTPTISIYKDGKEIKRIMGVVSISNMEMIYERIKR